MKTRDSASTCQRARQPEVPVAHARGLQWYGLLAVAGGLLVSAGAAQAAISCARTLTANIVAIDQPLMFNRLGAQNINGMVYALERDVVNTDTMTPLSKGGAAVRGKVQLRPDKRPRPLVLRIAAGDCLQVNLKNLLTDAANPRNNEVPPQLKVSGQVADRTVGFNVSGMQAVNSIDDLATNVGKNANALIAPGAQRSYKFYGEHEGVFVATSYGATFGGEGTAGNVTNGLFGQVVVVPKGGKIYRNAVTEEELRLASTGRTSSGHPIVDYEARYPNQEPWISEGKAGLPILNTIDGNEIVASAGDAIVMGPNADGTFPPSTYPLESIGKRNPAYPNRLEPFRDFSSAFHDEAAAAQAFPGFFGDPVFGHVLHGTRDTFMIDYGAGGIGSEIIANRLGVGPMHDCLSCAYEEFFLTSHVVGDPAMLVDVPANVGLEALLPGQAPPAGATGIKATKALYPSDPSNVHHAYIGDFVKFRNTHVGHEQHIFHLHNNQWLFNPNDDNSNYIDAQGIGPGTGYTYELVNGGAGNRNRSAGDAIYHCHFYPHFAQGMWKLLRVHDVFEEGTRLAVSNGPDNLHTAPFALRDGTPAVGARALPDGEIVAGTPIPAIVPLPGKAMPPMPGTVAVVPKIDGVSSVVVGSVAKVDRSPANREPDGTLKNPGFPFWVAGLEDTIGNRPPTPPLDMLNEAQAQALRDSGNPLWSGIDPAQAKGWDGGLPRHAIEGIAAGGQATVTTSALDFSKVVTRAKPVYFPEEGTEVEQAAMAFHAKASHPSFAVLPNGSTVERAFRTNGAPPVVGAPFMEPCVDDTSRHMTKAYGNGKFFSGETLTGMSTIGSSPFAADNPRIYKGANIQFDAVLNKVGYHYPQQRIITLWEDAYEIIEKRKAPEPLVMRMNTFDCTMYYHTNLVPEFYELDDYQIRTPTDIIGQHIHLPKWDLTTTDGAANGWNYEDGTLSPHALNERIRAIRNFNSCTPDDARNDTPACPNAEAGHPFFEGYGRHEWLSARTTIQRWYSDPVVNAYGVHRGLGNIFTHDHYGPSSHQQIGLYATVLTEPAGSTWYHAETGEKLYTRDDGGPTSWQAVIATGDLNGDGKNDSYREFYLEYSDFQHAYEAGVYVGAGPDGIPNRTAYPVSADTFRYAINPPARKAANPFYPDLTNIVAGGQLLGCPTRPCPQAISVDDPGMFVVNYRNEPIGLRVYDPNRTGPDGKPGMQAEGLAGDLAYAFQSRTDRKIAALNKKPSEIVQATGPTGGTTDFPPHINHAGDEAGDPFTPMLRTYAGDRVRVRVQAGGHEEEHNTTVHGVKWLQAGSSYGFAPNSGWKNAQSAGISEQFTFAAPVFLGYGAQGEMADHLYSVDSSIEGYWNGAWGVMRNYTKLRADLHPVPNNPRPITARNAIAFNGICPKVGADRRPTPLRRYDVVAALANDILGNPLGLTIGMAGAEGMHVGGPLKPDGGTLVYNSRATSIPEVTVIDEEEGTTVTIGGHNGPLHDPAAILYVRKDDLDPATGKLKAGVPVEPLVLRAAAGDCIEVTVENRLPVAMPDLPSRALMMPITPRDRNGAQGVTTFNNNLLRPSSEVGLHMQLVSYDVTSSDGLNVGINPVQTIPPRQPGATDWPKRKYQYYAGDLRLAEIATTKDAVSNVDTILSEPVEFGGLNVTPADLVKQTQKGLVGAMIVEPRGARWTEDATMRAGATVYAPGQPVYRDFALVMHKGLSLYYGNGLPVENTGNEGFLPNDSKDNSGMAVNYRTEPLWYRFGKAPNTPFGGAGGNGLADVSNAHMAYSNNLTGGLDPETPILKVDRGQPFRIHVSMPTGGGRQSTFGLTGHVWQRDPYLAQTVDSAGFPQKYYGVGSTRIGDNPLAMYLGGQENVLPAAHWSFVIPSAGGKNSVPGDYLYRDLAAFGNLSGMWGILRVQ